MSFLPLRRDTLISMVGWCSFTECYQSESSIFRICAFTLILRFHFVKANPTVDLTSTMFGSTPGAIYTNNNAYVGQVAVFNSQREQWNRISISYVIPSEWESDFSHVSVTEINHLDDHFKIRIVRIHIPYTLKRNSFGEFENQNYADHTSFHKQRWLYLQSTSRRVWTKTKSLSLFSQHPHTLRLSYHVQNLFQSSPRMNIHNIHWWISNNFKNYTGILVLWTSMRYLIGE